MSLKASCDDDDSGDSDVGIRVPGTDYVLVERMESGLSNRFREQQR